MIRHIVLMKLLNEAEGHDKQYNGQRIKAGMEALPAQIEGMISSTVLLGNADRFDVCITNEFVDEEAMNYFGAHPLHQEMRTYIHKVVQDNRPSFVCEL